MQSRVGHARWGESHHHTIQVSHMIHGMSYGLAGSYAPGWVESDWDIRNSPMVESESFPPNRHRAAYDTFGYLFRF